MEFSGLVLTLDEDEGLHVSGINPRRLAPFTCRWRWGQDGQLINVAYEESVSYDFFNDRYSSGSQEYISFRTLGHYDESN